MAKSLKNWPMPQDVKHENWGYTAAGTSDNKIDDTKSMIDGMTKQMIKLWLAKRQKNGANEWG